MFEASMEHNIFNRWRCIKKMFKHDTFHEFLTVCNKVQKLLHFKSEKRI